MRALLKRDANIIEVPDDFARLESITQDGYFIYKIRYRVDPVKAVRSRAFMTVISATEKPQVRRQVRTFTNFNPVLINKRLRMRRALTKDILRQEAADRIVTIISDITRKIPNNQTISLARATFTSPPTITRVQRVRPALVNTIRQQNLALPILDRNTTRIPSIVQSDTLADAKRSVRLRSSRLALDRKRDPASFVGAKTNSIASATRAINGTVSLKSPAAQTNIRLGTPLVSTLLNQKNYANQFQLRNSAYFNVPLREESTWIEIEETLRLPVGSLLSEEFFLTFELRNNRELDVQTLTRSIPHSENIAKLQIPTEPPEIVAFSVGALGRTTLSVKQKDRNATKIRIFRRELNKGNPAIDAQYDFVGEVEADFGEDFKKIDDLYASTNPIIYRAVPVNGDEILGAEFSSTVIEQKSPPFSRGKFKRQPYFASLDHEVQGRSVVITIRDIAPGPIAMRLLRKDLSINQQNFSIVQPSGQGSETILIEVDSNAPIVIEDNQVKEGRIYEYKALFIFDSGTEEIAANNVIVEFLPVSANILELEIGEPNVEQSGDEIDVSFSIEKNIIQTQGDLIKSFLEEQGITTEFQDQLLANREQLQNLFGVRVTRRNLTTGELEDFGIISSPNFSDKRFGRVRSVKPLQGGLDYKYNITAHARDTETLFPTLNKLVNPRTNVSYSFSPSRWRHPITLLRGNVVTSRTLVRNHAKSTFTFGRVVDNRSLTVSLADIQPSLLSGKAVRFGENKVLVQWKVQGDVNKIDHFIVILEILGMRTIVGKSHNITNSNYFQFIDNLTNKESGELTYFIVPVFFDYGRGPELKTNSVLI